MNGGIDGTQIRPAVRTRAYVEAAATSRCYLRHQVGRASLAARLVRLCG